MTLRLYLLSVLMFLLGQALHLFWIKIPAVKKRANAANHKFSWAEYWREDWHLIIGTNVFGIMLIAGLDQLLNWKPAILEYVKWFFGGVGVFASTVILGKLSQYEKMLTKVIDIKTNIADDITQKDT